MQKNALFNSTKESQIDQNKNAKKFLQNLRLWAVKKTDLGKGTCCAQLKVWVYVIQGK